MESSKVTSCVCLQVRFRRGGMKTQIEVDGIRDSKSYEVSCSQMTSLVFGGVSPHDKEDIKSIMVSHSSRLERDSSTFLILSL